MRGQSSPACAVPFGVTCQCGIVGETEDKEDGVLLPEAPECALPLAGEEGGGGHSRFLGVMRLSPVSGVNQGGWGGEGYGRPHPALPGE